MNARDNAQGGPDWLTSWPLPCTAADGREVTMMVGVARGAEGPSITAQVADETVLVLSFRTAVQLSANLQHALDERLRMISQGED